MYKLFLIVTAAVLFLSMHAKLTDLVSALLLLLKGEKKKNK